MLSIGERFFSTAHCETTDGRGGWPRSSLGEELLGLFFTKGRSAMTLYQMSAMYRHDAEIFRKRINELRARTRESKDPVEIRELKERIVDLQTMRRQSKELEMLTRRYYERWYHRDVRYTLNAK